MSQELGDAAGHRSGWKIGRFLCFGSAKGAGGWVWSELRNQRGQGWSLLPPCTSSSSSFSSHFSTESGIFLTFLPSDFFRFHHSWTPHFPASLSRSCCLRHFPASASLCTLQDPFTFPSTHQGLPLFHESPKSCFHPAWFAGIPNSGTQGGISEGARLQSPITPTSFQPFPVTCRDLKRMLTQFSGRTFGL